MLTVYGKKMSRAGRVLWVLEELGLDYKQVPVDPFAGDTKTPEYLAMNPMAKVPTLVDGDFVLWESVAIGIYLAAKAGSPLWPSDLKAQARVNQWSSWATTEVEYHLTQVVREKRRTAAEGTEADAALIGRCLAGTADTIAVLESWLASGNAYVAGSEFTIGDINAAFPIMGASQMIDMTPYPTVKEWLGRCTGRDAWKRVMAKEEVAA